jgi:hypothetical protein
MEVEYRRCAVCVCERERESRTEKKDRKKNPDLTSAW